MPSEPVEIKEVMVNQAHADLLDGIDTLILEKCADIPHTEILACLAQVVGKGLAIGGYSPEQFPQVMQMVLDNIQAGNNAMMEHMAKGPPTLQ